MTSGTITTLLETTVNAGGQPIAYPQGGTPEVKALLVEMAPGERTPWHQHPVPLLGYLLCGELTVYQASGGKRVVRAGQVSLETVGAVHLGINEGTEMLRMVVFVVGLEDVPFTSPGDAPENPPV